MKTKSSTSSTKATKSYAGTPVSPKSKAYIGTPINVPKEKDKICRFMCD